MAMGIRAGVITLFLFFFLAGTSAAALVDNGDGTVIDTVTCLQWQQATMDTTGDGTPDAMAWQDALSASENLTLAGHSDWRLPDILELRSIVDYNSPVLYPSIDTDLFPDTLRSDYWSSTTFAELPFFGWLVSFNNGSDHRYGKSSSYYVRAVRGGQCGALGYSTVSATAGPNGYLDGSTPSPQTVANGSAIMFTFNAAAGYYVAAVSGCGVDYSNIDHTVSTYSAWTRVITGDCTVRATFVGKSKFPWTMFLPAITGQ